MTIKLFKLLSDMILFHYRELFHICIKNVITKIYHQTLRELINPVKTFLIFGTILN